LEVNSTRTGIEAPPLVVLRIPLWFVVLS